MPPETVPSPDTPHLTPASLVGRRFGKDAFSPITVALVGYCPRPSILGEYGPQPTDEQHFIHVAPASVERCCHDGIGFLSIVHVYGGPVSAALLEELAYYGFQYVLAYGLAGGLLSESQAMGDYYIIERALALDGTTPHYTADRLVASDGRLNATLKELAEAAGLPKLTPVQALTSDAIYREYDKDLDYARQNGCDIVNCDSSHLFAVSRDVGIRATECGVISDVAQSKGENWQSTLSEMLSSSGDRAQDPMMLVGRIVRFYVETLIPQLVEDSHPE
jgi:uridine phosphorylase